MFICQYKINAFADLRKRYLFESKNNIICGSLGLARSRVDLFLIWLVRYGFSD